MNLTAKSLKNCFKTIVFNPQNFVIVFYKTHSNASISSTMSKTDIFFPYLTCLARGSCPRPIEEYVQNIL